MFVYHLHASQAGEKIYEIGDFVTTHGLNLQHNDCIGKIIPLTTSEDRYAVMIFTAKLPADLSQVRRDNVPKLNDLPENGINDFKLVGVKEKNLVSLGNPVTQTLTNKQEHELYWYFHKLVTLTFQFVHYPLLALQVKECINIIGMDIQHKYGQTGLDFVYNIQPAIQYILHQIHPWNTQS